jgi:protein-S-isoprenylcysteine O-methyltransferase Ste14
LIMDLTGPALTLAIFTLYAILHSLLASLWAKGRSRALFGNLSDRGYRFAYNLLAGITFIPVLGILAAYPGDTLYRIPMPWVLLTAIMQLVGAAIIMIGMLQTDLWHFLGLRQLTQATPSAESPLVINGLYRYMRHPLYTGGLLLIWFLPLMTTNLLAFNLAATLYLYMGSIFEERRLIAEFGEQYRHYQRSVPRLIPSPWRNPWFRS